MPDQQHPDRELRFEDIYQQELEEIRQSRLAKSNVRHYEDSPVEGDLSGIALSGGSVRSATFSLGVFQGLAKHSLLSRFDYLSSTGGGAYAAGWLVRWIQMLRLYEVERLLAGEGKGEAREIESLRQSNVSPLRMGPGFIGGSSAALAWVRNVLTNLFTLALLYCGVILCAKSLMDLIDHNVNAEASSATAVVMAVVGSILFGVFGHLAERPLPSRPLKSSLFWMAAIVLTTGSFFAGVGIAEQTHTDSMFYGFRPEGFKIIPVAIAFCCFCSWFPRSASIKLRLAQLVFLVLTGAIGSLLIIQVAVPLSRAVTGLLFIPPQGAVYYSDTLMMQFTGPLVLACFAISLLVYALLLKRLMSAAIGSLFWRLCRFLLCFASLWFLCSWLSNYPDSPLSPLDPILFRFIWPASLALMVFLTIGGLLRVAGLRTSQRGKLVFDLLERIAPYAFTIGLTQLVIEIVLALWKGPPQVQVVFGLILILLSLLFFWVIRVSGFSLHHFHKTQTIRNYLEPAGINIKERKTDVDGPLNALTNKWQYDGPYPLFGASLDVVDTSKMLLRQPRTVPFLLSPLFSGFDLSRSRDADAEVSTAYRPSMKFGGGISLADAITIAQPFRDQSLRPPSAPAAMLWTIFSMREGRFIGNPVRPDKWNKRGPLIEPIYALREGYGEFASEAAFVRPSPGRDFDNLSIYQLVKRRCRFILACDATHDPDFSFNDLGETIRRCRTELGVEIEMDLGPLGRTTHCQIARIRYSADETGFIIYIKPSLTGNEPADLIQYAKSHPEFPAARTRSNTFAESDFESYRRLGEHIVDSLVVGLKISSQTTTSQFFHAIRRRLQPDLKGESAVGASDESVSTPPQDLVDAVASGECVLCAGPGLAAQAKLPVWSAFLEGLLRTAREKQLIDNVGAAGLTATLNAGELEAVADDLIHQIPRAQVVDYVRSATSASELSEAHQILGELHFLGALNTSMDNVLGRAFNSPTLVSGDADKLVESLQAKTFFVANLFGDATHPSSLAFTMKEFRSVLSASSQFKQFLGTLFLRYTIIFVGSGIDGVRNYLDALELPHLPERKHFALIPNASVIDPVKVRFLERSYNLRIVDYQPEFNFSGLPSFLKRLQRAVEQSPARRRATGSLSLKSVDLENIGPFESLHVDLTPGWNLLLGDNGVGKTVLLKAIAVALCGKQVDAAAAARLLRSGSAKGTISLKDENREYTVSLERQDDGSVEVKSASLSPIIYESWLVLGFPALRSVPLERPEGPSKPKAGAPSVEDLLPILRSKPDDRISNIKQWLINLDYASKSEGEGTPSRKLFEDFFEVLQQLTPDLRIEPGEINDKTMEITIKTDAGQVPLEAISQGTGSVMCWIGTLLQRLHETGNDRNQSQKSVLVLVDELDAHMHPKWQQMFVDAFRNEFRNVQIIATTHSPLLVGSLKPEEIWLVRRAPLKSEIDGVVHVKEGPGESLELVVVGAEDDSENGQPVQPREEKTYVVSRKEKLLIRHGETVEKGEPLTEREISVEIQQIKEKPEGWRADQILTSPLFELETTRDPETARLLDEYNSLMVLAEQTPGYKERLEHISKQLRIRLPTPQETAEARKAYEIIESFAKQQLERLTNEERQNILNEVKLQLTESVTGSRRPE
jgi:hypothetical protein